MVRFRLNSVNIESPPFDHHGDVYVLGQEGSSGWYESPDVRREEIARAMSHGAFNLPGYRSQRLIGLPGHILARTPATLIHLQDRLSGLLADGNSGRLAVDDAMGTRWCDVRLSGCSIEQIDSTTSRFLLQLWAADPRKYGETHTFESGESVYHYGNFPATPTLVVPGSHAAWSASAGSAQVVVSQSLTSGQTHRYDARTGRLTRNDALQVGVVTRGDSWSVAPGQSLVHTISGGGQVRITDTYM